MFEECVVKFLSLIFDVFYRWQKIYVYYDQIIVDFNSIFYIILIVDVVICQCKEYCCKMVIYVIG